MSEKTAASTDRHAAEIDTRLADVEMQLANPATTHDSRQYADLTRLHRELNEIQAAYRVRNEAADVLRQAREMLADDDPEIQAMAREELAGAEATLASAEHNLRILLLPRDPHDAKNTIMEIRAGTGGDEAALFAGDLFRLYSRHAELRGWRVELISASESDLGGFKEIIFSVIGESVYSYLKYEGGGHRVQRVPATETQGRIHTSAVTVAVMPEAEEVDVLIRNEDIKIDVFRSSGPGGQSVNTTDSAVRITHLPTGLVVSCQDEKSQLKNKAKGMKVLRARLLDLAIQTQNAEVSAQRKAQVGSGDRSQRIRTYNFPQNRLTDHRVNLTLYSLDRIMEGYLDLVTTPLIEHFQTEELKQAGM